MKRFVLRISSFIFLLVFVFGIPYLLSDFYLNIRKQHYLTLDRNIKIVFAGDSHIEAAIDDRMIPNSINIACSGEHYIYTYIKLRSLLEYNSQIQTVFLSFYPNSLDKIRDETWLFSEAFIVNQASLLYLMNYPERLLIIRNNGRAYIESLRKCTLWNLMSIVKSFGSGNLSDSNFDFGGYKSSGENKLRDDIKRLMSQQHHFERGKYQEWYLRMISQLCQKKSVRLILLNTPEHKYLTTNLGKDIEEDWAFVRQTLPMDSLLDLSETALPDSCFGDTQHLSRKGAEVFSRYLCDKIQSAKGSMEHEHALYRRPVDR